MKKIFSTLFSMRFAGMLLLTFAAVVGAATFIENDLGTRAAKDMVYSALWFEVLLFLTSLSLLGSIFKYRLFQRRKYSTLSFHLAFVIILIGALITRYVGYEGIMSIREGETSNTISTVDPYIQIWVSSPEEEFYYDKGINISPYRRSRFSTHVETAQGEISIRFKKIIPNAVEQIVADPHGVPMISFVNVEGHSRNNAYLKYGQSFTYDTILLNFGDNLGGSNIIQLDVVTDTFMFKAPFMVTRFDMMLNKTDSLEAHQWHELTVMKLYNFNGNQILFRELFPAAKTTIVTAHGGRSNGTNASLFELSFNEEKKEVAVFGAPGMISEPITTSLGNYEVSISYGSKKKEIPFSLHLVDFQLERYPGSMSPSSFASQVMVIDEEEGLEMPYRIFMNNVLNYRGFRFFQSSYDTDELGTVLSVNHDKWGTLVTYLGYFILTLGLLLNFFSPSSRFRALVRNSSRLREEAKRSAMLIILLSISSIFAIQGTAQEANYQSTHYVIDKAHAASFGELLVQGSDGRIKPINTLSSEILRKIYRKNSLNGLKPDQVMLGMLVNPGHWQAYPMIKVSDGELKSLIGISGKYASFYDFIDEQGGYKLSEHVDKAYNASPALRSSFDKDVIAVDERVNIVYMIYTGEMLTIFPKGGDPDNKWYSGFNPSRVFDSLDAGFVENILPLYYTSVIKATQSGVWDTAQEYLGYLKHFQDKYGAGVIPASSKIKTEIIYNKVNIFKRLFPIYSLLGLVMLILLFTGILNTKLKFGVIIKILIALLAIAFLLHTAGLAARWYIAGRAPWSNGYETMIYISWGIVLSGFIFARNSKITLATTAILASLTLMVANLSWLNPEITNLVPVLKSYWLVIHVAVITASYSFLAIGALLGLLNLMLINFMTAKNRVKIKHTLDELTNINEMNLIIGVFLLTIGTFLGAVWANESWGRYWGWDPKEAWALVTVLVYSFVVHMRMIPGLNGNFAFNFASLISFSSVLMTYFGVNYFLSGMHSYAAGDAAKVPTFVYYAVLVVAVVSILGYINHRKLQKE